MHQILAQHFVNEGNIKAAIEQYREALRIDSRLSGSHFELGEAILQDSLKTDSQEEARKEFESALQQNPNDEKAECWLGALAFLQGRTDDALRYYTHALQLNPEDASAQVGIAKVLISLGHQKEALEHLLVAVRIDPSSSNAHFQLSRLYRQMNRPADADRETVIFKRLRETEERFSATFYRPRVDSQLLDAQTPQDP
jgi:tetratricopeptide (TPR) repeat protein